MRINEVATRLGVTTRTLARWEREGRIPNHLSGTGRRYYTLEDVHQIKETMALGPKLPVNVYQKPETTHAPVEAPGATEDEAAALRRREAKARFAAKWTGAATHEGTV